MSADADTVPARADAAPTPEQRLDAIARALVDDNRYLTLGTADAHGLTWVAPLWYAAVRQREFFWVGSPDASHSRNLAARPDVRIVIFDSPGPVEGGASLHVKAVAEELTGLELDRGIRIFSRASEGHGARAWTRADVLPPAPHRLYRATASELSLQLTGGDERGRRRAD